MLAPQWASTFGFMFEPDESRSLSVRPYGDRWAVLVGDQVVLVSNSRKAAEVVVAEANDVLEQSGLRPERRSFAQED